MKLVRQVTQNSCCLACIESFLFDNQVYINQERILADFPVQTYANDPILLGLLNSADFDALGTKLGFRVEQCDLSGNASLSCSSVSQLFKVNWPMQTVLICARQWVPGAGNGHCLRFHRMWEDRFEAMNPTLGAFETHSLKDLPAWEAILVRLTLCERR